MTFRTSLLLVTFICFVSIFASADSVSSIPIHGWVNQGFATSSGEFNITGPNLSLFQGSLDGPSNLGLCNVGAACSFSLGIGSDAGFCAYCTGLSGGSLGNKVAEFLVPNLTLTGSALYSGGSLLNVPMTITGTIIGYELINCQPGGFSCSLGPIEFTLHIVAHGTGQFTMDDQGTFGVVAGMTISNLTGTATAVPEPISLVLTGTGLVGIWIRKKAARPK